MNELLSIVRQLTRSQQPAALATLVTVAGSSYRRTGARLLFTSDGVRLGSISGGCLEEDVLARAGRVLATGRAELATYDTSSENDALWGVGLGCHGVVQILIECVRGCPPWARTLAENLSAQRPTDLAVVWQAADPSVLGTHLAAELPTAQQPNSRVFLNSIAPPVALFVFGAGDDAQPLARLSRELGWRVTIADPRSAFATAHRFPTASAVIAAPANELVARVDPPKHSVAVVMTHHYVHDVPILRDLLARDLRYVGLLGPKKRAERIQADLVRDGLSPNAPGFAKLHSPVGLDLGAETPDEVALSIVAEIKSVLSTRDARPLRERSQPIHG